MLVISLPRKRSYCYSTRSVEFEIEKFGRNRRKTSFCSLIHCNSCPDYPSCPYHREWSITANPAVKVRPKWGINRPNFERCVHVEWPIFWKYVKKFETFIQIIARLRRFPLQQVWSREPVRSHILALKRSNLIGFRSFWSRKSWTWFNFQNWLRVRQ